MATQTDPAGTRAFRVTSRTESARKFRKAKRHSRFVRVLRVAIPVLVVVGGAATFLVVTVLRPLQALANLPASVGSVVVAGTKITMHQPRLTGFSKDMRPYVVTARAAIQDVTDRDKLELEDVRATMETQDKTTFEVSADAGVFETKADRLTLQRNVVVSSANYEAHLIEAVANVRTNHIVSERPVEVIMQQGKINANRLEVLGGGDVIRFEGGVTTFLAGQDAKANETARAK